MTIEEIHEACKAGPLVTCSPRVLRSKIGIQLSRNPPDEAGVYVVYIRDGNIPFYVGESSNLRRRLIFLFRCYRSDNPHPCHLRHEDVWESLPDCDTFCETYGVRWHSTARSFGRLEAEEELQKRFGTNRNEFYLNLGQHLARSFPPLMTSTAEATQASDLTQYHKEAENLACQTSKECGGLCPVWQELTTRQAYQCEPGIQVPTMTGRKEDLFFCYQPTNAKTVIRVWRASGTLDFTFDEHDCLAICQRFVTGLHEDRNFVEGGTAYFNDPSWRERPLNIITAPYAASIIRYARQTIGLPV
jgi:hypothetical protein